MIKIVTVNDEPRVFINIAYAHGSQTVCQGTQVCSNEHPKILQNM